MNPLIGQRVKQITKGIEGLKAELTEAQQQLEDLAEARNELQKKCWAQAKEIAMFKERLEELGPLKEQNAQVLERLAELEERLRRVLSQTEALEAEFHP
jgi:chromosome segregation ATPase